MKAKPALHPALALAVSVWLMLTPACSSPAGGGRALTCASAHAQNAELPRIIVFGEVHGIEEAPKFLGNWICNLAIKGEAVVVGIEHPFDEQALLDRFMGMHGAEASGILLSIFLDATLKTYDGAVNLGHLHASPPAAVRFLRP